MTRLSEEQCAWLALGVPGAVATLSGTSQPTIARVFAVRASEDRKCLEFSIARSDAHRTLGNVSQHPLATVTLACPRNYRSLQFKGPCAPLNTGWEDGFFADYMSRVAQGMAEIGMHPNDYQRMLGHYTDPTQVVLSLVVEAVFDQTPGPQAGRQL